MKDSLTYGLPAAFLIFGALLLGGATVDQFGAVAAWVHAVTTVGALTASMLGIKKGQLSAFTFRIAFFSAMNITFIMGFALALLMVLIQPGWILSTMEGVEELTWMQRAFIGFQFFLSTMFWGILASLALAFMLKQKEK